MRLSKKSRAEKSFRELPVGARQQHNIRFEVHSASSVLKIAVDTTGATVTSLRLFSRRSIFILLQTVRSLMRSVLQGAGKTEW